MTLNGTTANWTTQSSQALSTETHNWPLNDAGADAVATAADTTNGTALPLTGSATGAVWYTKDLFSPDVSLDGSSGSLHASGPAVTTSQNFTVSVWADPRTVVAADDAVLSQDGSKDSGFALLASATGWNFCLAKTDTGPWNADCAESNIPVHLGLWTHLTATYNASTGEMALYLNGVPDGQATHTAVAGFTGDFQVGEDLLNGARNAYFNGDVSQIQTWNQTLTPAQVLAAGMDGANATATLFPSSGRTYPSGSQWNLGADTMTFNAGLLTVSLAGTPLYTLGKTGYPNAVLTLQSDGNLVSYDDAADAALGTTGSLGSTATYGHAGDAMLFQPDGNLVIYDAYGNVLWASHTDYVGSDRWQLTAAGNGADAASTNPGTAAASVSYGPDHANNANGAAVFDGTDGIIRTNAPAVVTTGSYTVSAWVKLNNLTNAQIAVGQGTVNHQSFYLGMNPSNGGWIFQTTTADTAATTFPTVDAKATAGVWTHLVGTYDAANGSQALYVNGVLAGTTTNTTPQYSPGGALTIGAIEAAGSTAPYDQVNGSVSDVRVYPTAFSQAVVTSLYTSS